MTLTRKNIREQLDFAELGLENLEVRAVWTDSNKGSSQAKFVLLEEPPTVRVTAYYKSSTPVPIWTPWTYHQVCIEQIELKDWMMNGKTWRIFGSHKQITKESDDKKFPKSSLMNVSPDCRPCYKAEWYEGTPAQKIARSINNWWMGSTNLDYRPNTSPTGLQRLITERLHERRYRPPAYDYEYGTRAVFPDIRYYANYLYMEDTEEYIKVWSELSLKEVLEGQKDAIRLGYGVYWTNTHLSRGIRVNVPPVCKFFSNRYSRNRKVLDKIS